MEPVTYRMRISTICLAALLATALRPALAEEQREVPKKFAASIEHASHGRYSIELDGSALLYRASWSQTIRISPTLGQWREFRRTINDIDLWRWRSRYDRSVSDGEQWSLYIEYSDRSKSTQGYASYPEEAARSGGCLRTTVKPFTRFRYAVQKLLGDRPFGERVGPLELFDLAELQLVATHPSSNPSDRWAALRDPTGKVHHVSPYVPGARGRRAQQPSYVGVERALLREVTATSISLLELCHDAQGEWFERTTVVKKAGAP